MPSYPVRLNRRTNGRPPSVLKAGRRFDRVPPGALASFTRCLAVLVGAGMPVTDALETAGQGLHRALEDAVRQVRADVCRGASLSAALAGHPDVFGALYVRLVAVGEAAGRLPDLLARLAAYGEKDHLLRRRVRLALAYPALLVLVGTAVTVFLVLVVVPTFADLFADFGAELPRPTQFVLAISDRIGRALPWLGAAGAGAGFGVRMGRRTPAGRRLWDAGRIRMPLFGRVVRKSLTARFCRTLGTLLRGGVELVDALDLAAGAAGHVQVEQAVRAMRDEVMRGAHLACPAESTSVFPGLIVRLIAVGEATAQLDRMLLHAAAYYEREVEDAVEGLAAVLEPLLILLIGTLLGGLLAALYLPMFELGGLVG